MIENKGRIFRIAGVSGSGKTTITALLDKLAREAGTSFANLDTKAIQCRLAKVKNEREYRQIPEEERRTLFPSLMQEIVEIADSQPAQIWFFERHLCSMNENGSIISRGIPDEHGPRMIGQGLIIAHECLIARWREMDQEIRHDRHLLQPEQIAVEQTQEIELALNASRQWDFPTHLFFNEPGQSVKVASEILFFLKKLQNSQLSMARAGIFLRARQTTLKTTFEEYRARNAF